MTATAFSDLPGDSFPHVIELLDTTTGELRWTVTITDSCVLQIPGKNEINSGQPVTMRVTFPDGEVLTEERNL